MFVVTIGTMKTNRDALLRVRVRQDTKNRIEKAADVLELDQSSLIRLALREYIERHLPALNHAA